MPLLFIFESLGTAELVVIGIVALIIFGPRKLPEFARTIAKTMADFRNTTAELKDTWQREVDLENLESSPEPKTIAKNSADQVKLPEGVVAPPVIRNIDDASIADHFNPENRVEEGETSGTAGQEPEESDKKNWL